MSRARTVAPTEVTPMVARRPSADLEAIEEAGHALAELTAVDGSGVPLGDDLRRELEPLLGHGLEAVRIHCDGEAGDLAAALGAEAFVHGTHVWFAPGRFQPGTPAGRELLVHELAHAFRSGVEPPTPDAAEERRADDVAAHDRRTDDTPPTVGDHEHRGRPLTTAVTGLAKRAAPERSTLWAGLRPDRILVRLVDSLLRRNPSDRGGRIRAVVDRMDDPTRREVLADFADRGGAQWKRLTGVLRDRVPDDGGTEPTAPPADGTDVADEAVVPDDTDETRETDKTGETDELSETTAPEAADEPAPAAPPVDQPEPLEFDPEAELAPEPGPDEPAVEAPDTADESTEGGEERADADPDAANETAPAADAASAEVSSTGANTAQAGEGAEIEEELAEALEPALQNQVPTDDEAAALVELQQTNEEEDAGTDDREPDREPEPGRADGGLPTIDEAMAGDEATAGAAGPVDVAPGVDAADAPGLARGEAAEEPEAAPGAPSIAPEDELAVDPAEPGLVDDAPDDAAVAADPVVDPAAGGDVPGEVGAPATGGDCAPAPPAPMQDPAGGGGGGCGGGGGGGDDSAAAEPEPAATPADTPAAAVGAVAGRSASARPAALESAGTSATAEVSEVQDALAAAPPSMERPSGAPSGRNASLAPPALPPPTPSEPRHQPELTPASGGTLPEITAPPPAPADVTTGVPSPRLAGDTKITKDDASKVRKAVTNLPTTDPALNVDVGPTPKLVLDGEADPGRVTEQATGVLTTTTALQQEANGQIVEDLGDRDIYPHVPKENLVARIDVSQISIAPTGGADTGKIPPVVIDRVAEDESGPADRAKIRTEAGGMTAGRSEHDAETDKSRKQAEKDLDQAVDDNAGSQRELRQTTANTADAGRQSWVDATAATSRTTRDATTAATTAADRDVGAAETKAKTDATTAVTDGNAEIRRQRTTAEGEARRHKADAERESSGGGFFSWLGSKVTSFFNKFKGLIKKAFDAARKLVDEAVRFAQKAAVAAIELGRKAAIAAIEVGGKALTAAGDIALAGFPEAREKWRSTIKSGVERSKQAVNELADDLKEGVKAILDWLGKALKAALSALEKVYMTALEAVEAVVQGAIKAAKAIADVFGAFLEIAADVARGPVRWLKKLGAAAMDGARNCTWPAVKAAVKQWFREKVEEVVGVGKAVFDILLKGCITFAQVAKMAWTAIKASLPGILVQLLIEKLVAMLIPAGGALSLIIDGLRAAWGAAGRILAAFQRFVDFLLAVRAGQAAAKFGTMVGAAAVAVLDFLSNFVLQRIMAAGKKVGGALKQTAGKIMAQLKKAAAAAKKAAGTAVGAVKKTAKAGLGAARKAGGKAVSAVKKTAVKAKTAVAKSAVGKAVIAGGKAVTRGGRKLVDKGKQLAAKRRQKAAAKGKKPPKKKETPQQKLDRIVAILRPKIEGWFDKGIGRVSLWSRLKLLKVRHRLRGLVARRGAGRLVVDATLNPTMTVGDGFPLEDAELNQIVREVSEAVLQEAWLADIDAPQPGGQGFLARARDAQFPFRDPSDTPSGPGKKKAHRTEQTHLVGQDRIPVEEKRGFGEETYSRTNWHVEAMGKYDQAGSSKPAVHDVLTGFGDGDDRIGAQRLAKFVRTGQVPAKLAGRERELAAAAHLLFTRETSRRTANVAHSAMALDLVTKGDATFRSLLASPGRDSQRLGESIERDRERARTSGTALKLSAESKRLRSGGELPVSMEGAMQGARGASPEIHGGKQAPGNTLTTKELMRREAALTKKWLRSIGWTMNHNATSTAQLKQLVADDLRRRITARLRRFYGLGTARRSRGEVA